MQVAGKSLTVRPLSKAEAEEFQSEPPNVLTPPLAASERPPAPHIPVSPPRVGVAAAKPAAAAPQQPEPAAPAQSKAEAAAAPAAPAAKSAAARAAPNGKVPSGPPSRVLRLANMVRPSIAIATSVALRPTDYRLTVLLLPHTLCSLGACLTYVIG